MLLEVQNLFGGYGKVDICKDISCAVNNGEILCLLGPNGCGKSTLFRLVLGFLNASNGKVLLNGKNIAALSPHEMAKQVAYIPQNHTPIFNYTALDIVTMGRASHFATFSRPSKVDYAAAMNMLDMLGILECANTEYTTLSGGQRQLVLIARALCQDTRLLVMDEPAANLDYANDQKVLSVIRKLSADGYGILLSSHSPELPFTLANRVLLMKEGKLVATGPPSEVLTPSALHNVYGIEMDVVSVQDRYQSKHTLCIPAYKSEEHY